MFEARATAPIGSVVSYVLNLQTDLYADCVRACV